MPLPIADVPPEHVVAIWPHARDLLAKPLKREGSGRFELPDILDLLLANKVRLWVAWNPDTKSADAAIVTEMIDYPRLRELRIWLVGGRPGTFRQWVYATRDTLEAYATAHGCAFITGGMRKGWLKIGGPGWRETGISFEKDLR